MRITMYTHGTRGDVWPIVALAVELADRGHHPTVAAPGECRGYVEAAGLPFVALPLDLMAYLATDEGQRLMHAGGLGLTRKVAQLYSDHAGELDDSFVRAASGAEAIVANHLTLDRAQAIGDHLQIPVAVVFPWPLVATREFGSPILTKGRVRSPMLRYLSHRLLIRLWTQGNVSTTRAFRRRLSLPPNTTNSTDRQSHPGALALHTFSPSLLARPRDWPDQLKVTSAWQTPAGLRDATGETLPSALRTWIDAGDPPVFMGFGSMPVLDPRTILQDIAAVTSALGVRAVINAGWAGDDAIVGGLPDHLRVVGPVDHDRLLPHCRAAVHHGGAGTTAASLRAGCPTLICSVWNDQPWWGELVVRRGVGAHVPFRKLDRQRLSSGLQAVLDPDVRRRTQALGATMRAEGDGLRAAGQLLEDWLLTARPTPLTGMRKRPSRGPAAVAR